MYDAVLISTHYNYDDEGRIIPPKDAENYEDLSMIIPLGIIHIAQYLHDRALLFESESCPIARAGDEAEFGE